MILTKSKIPFLISALLDLMLSFGMYAGAHEIQMDGGAYGQSICNERIFMHIDRDTYVAGESLFFKLYLDNSSSKNSTDTSKIAYIILRNEHNTSIIRQIVLLQHGAAFGSIYLPDTLQTGHYQIIAFTNKMRNFGESGFFYQELMIANRFDEVLEFGTLGFFNDTLPKPSLEKSNTLILRTNKSVYGTREKVIITLSAPGYPGMDLSVSVAEKNDHSRKSGHGSACIQKYGKCEYMVENKGYILGGNVNRASPSPGILVTLSVPDTTANLMYATTDASGKFFFQLDPYYYNKELFVDIRDQKIRMESILTIDDKYALQSPVLTEDSAISHEMKQIIRKSQKIVGIHKTYLLQSIQYDTLTPSTETCRKVYYTPDHLIRTTDYEPMGNFVEIAREALLYVRLNKKDNLYKTEILDPVHKTIMNDPMFFINGMPVRDINPVIHFGSDKIKRIETVYRNRVYGSLELKGILAVFTTNDVKTDEFIDQRTVITEPIIFLRPSRYEPPDYSTPERRSARNPDFRQLLFWNPQVNIQGGRTLTLEFYTSDNVGNYEINIKGLTSDGNIIIRNASFQTQ
jgi:hypothetical protein